MLKMGDEETIIKDIRGEELVIAKWVSSKSQPIHTYALISDAPYFQSKAACETFALLTNMVRKVLANDSQLRRKIEVILNG